MKVAIYTQKKDSETKKYLQNFISELDRRNFSPVLYENSAAEMDFEKNIETFSNKEELKSSGAEFLFTFGGDGTLVNSILFVQDLEIPVVGVNMGRLGFLASFSKDDVIEDLDKILAGKTAISKRSVIELVSPKLENEVQFVLNDVSISRNETTAMITVDSYIDDEFLNVFWGDGVIISTPTGSTAYSLSCGGPIISPANENFAITPIAPHNLNVRPLIVNDDVEIKLRVQSRAPQFFMSLDSRLHILATSTEICLKKAPFKLSLVQPKDLSFYETIRQKLLWGQDKRN